MPYKAAKLQIRNIAGGKSIYPKGSVTTDDLEILANGVDISPYIKLNGTGAIYIYLPVGGDIRFGEPAGDGNFLTFIHNAGDVEITNPLDAHNIYLKTTGTGKLKFGTHTGAGDAATNGYIPILDAAGNTRKLATVA